MIAHVVAGCVRKARVEVHIGGRGDDAPAPVYRRMEGYGCRLSGGHSQARFANEKVIGQPSSEARSSKPQHRAGGSFLGTAHSRSIAMAHSPAVDHWATDRRR